MIAESFEDDYSLKSFWEKINSEILPNALMMGVEYDLFWRLNPKSLSPFIKAFELKQKYHDTIAWQQGLYTKMAIVSAMDKNVKYPNQPFSRNVGEELSDEEKVKRFKEVMIAKMIDINVNKFGEGVTFNE